MPNWKGNNNASTPMLATQMCQWTDKRKRQFFLHTTA